MSITDSYHPVNKIPSYILDRLNQPCPGEGERHEALKNLSYMLAGEGVPDDVSFSLLRQWCPDKAKSNSELRALIDGAHRRNPQPAKTGRRAAYGLESGTSEQPKYKRIPTPENPEGLPAPLTSGTAEFLKAVYGPDEIINIVMESTVLPESDKLAPGDGGISLPLKKWLEVIEREGGLQVYCNPLAGAWIGMNPLRDAGKGRIKENIAAFRYVLAESDQLTKAQQLAVFRASLLPIDVVIDSGGKSLHAWVRVDADSPEEYKRRQQAVIASLPDGFDSGVKDYSHLSRLPGITRAGKQQAVVALRIGAASWDEWEASAIDDGLPGYDDWAELCVRDIPKPEVLIDGLLHRGEVLMLCGGAKTDKSWTLAELEIAMATGGTWLGLKCQKGKVVCVDGELSEYFFRDRRQKIAQHTQAVIDPGMWKSLRLRGYVSNIFALADKLIRDYKGKDVTLIVIDPIYTLLGDDVEENSNEDIARVGSEMHRVARETGAAVAFSQHHAKGSQQGKRAIERASGAGSWGRFVDSSIDITAHTETGCFNFEITPRNFPPQNAFVARRMAGIPVWLREDGLKPEAKKGNDAAALTDLLQILGGQELTPGDWKQACEDKLRMPPATFDRRKKSAIKQGLVEQKGTGRAIVCKLPEGVVRNSAGVYAKATVFEVEG
jgi:RecA-family ATPase